MARVRPYNTATIFTVSLYTPAGDLASSPTLAAGDVKVHKRTSAGVESVANITTLPTVSATDARRVVVTLTASEMAAAQVAVLFSDQTSPAAWTPYTEEIETWGDTLAQFTPTGGAVVPANSIPNATAGATGGLALFGDAMTLTSAERAAFARAVHGYRNVYYVLKTGSDANDGLTPATAKLTVTAALALATAGDLVLVGPGVFDNGFMPLIVKNCVTLQGAGMAQTILRGHKDDYQAQDGSIETGGNAVIRDLTMTNDGTVPAGTEQPLERGIRTAGASGGRVVIERCDIYGQWDGLQITGPYNGLQVDVFDSVIRSNYDAVAIVGGGTGMIRLWNSHLIVTVGGIQRACGIAIRNTAAGYVEMYGGSIDVRTTAVTSTNAVLGVETYNANGSRATLTGVLIHASTTSADTNVWAAKTTDGGDPGGSITLADCGVARSAIHPTSDVTFVGTTDAPDVVAATNATGVKLHATQEFYAPAKAGDDMGLADGAITDAKVGPGSLTGKGDWGTSTQAAAAATAIADLDLKFPADTATRIGTLPTTGTVYTGGDITGSLSGSVGSVAGNVGGDVVGNLLGTLSTVERAAIGTQVWATTARSLTTFGTLVADIVAGVWASTIRTITGGTITTYAGNTPQTGDSFARIGLAGAGLTAIGDARLNNLDAAISSRMATFTYTAPLDAAGTRAALGLAAANLDTQFSSIVGGSGLDAAGVRAAIGMTEANMDAQLSGILADGGGGFTLEEIAAAFEDVDATIISPVDEDGSINVIVGDAYEGDLAIVKTCNVRAGVDVNGLPVELRFMDIEAYERDGEEAAADLTLTGTASQTGLIVTATFEATAAQTATLGLPQNGRGQTLFQAQIVEPADDVTIWNGRAVGKRKVV